MTAGPISSTFTLKKKKKNHKITQKLHLRQIEILLLIWCYFYYFTFNDDASPWPRTTAVEPKDKPDALNHLPLLLSLWQDFTFTKWISLYAGVSHVFLVYLKSSVLTRQQTFAAIKLSVIGLSDTAMQLSFMLIEFWGKRCCFARRNVNEPEIIQLLMRLPAQPKEKKQ